jgi:hypothetical protein
MRRKRPSETLGAMQTTPIAPQPVRRPAMDEPERARCVVIADRPGRFQWQADVSGPGTGGPPEPQPVQP